MGGDALKQLRGVAQLLGMTAAERLDFGLFIEDEKRGGNLGAKNDRGDFTFRESFSNLANSFSMGDVLSDAVSRGSASVIDALSDTLVGMRCVEVRRSYPGSLVVSFAGSGSPDVWTLFTEQARWDIEGDTGLLATDALDDEDGWAAAQGALVDGVVQRFAVRRSIVSLTIELDTATVDVHSRAVAHRDVAWELRTPDERILRAWTDLTFELVDGSSPYVSPEPVLAPEATLTGDWLQTMTAVRFLVRSAASDLGWTSFTRMGLDPSGPDMVLFRAGQTPLIFEFKRYPGKAPGFFASVTRPDLPAVEVPVETREQLAQALAALAA